MSDVFVLCCFAFVGGGSLLCVCVFVFVGACSLLCVCVFVAFGCLLFAVFVLTCCEVLLPVLLWLLFGFVC